MREEGAGGPGRPGTPSVLEGLRWQRMSPGIARELGLRPDTTGVAVTGVEPGSAAPAVEESIRKNDSTPALLMENRAGETLYIVFE